MLRSGLILLAGAAAAALASPAAAQTPTCRAEWPAFAALAGDWRVRLTYRLAPGQYETSDATASIVADPARCVLIEHLSSPTASRPMSFLFVSGFANADASERVYYDSEHARFLVFPGRWDGTAAWYERSQQMNANRVVNRTEVRPMSADAFTVETQLSTDGGGTWSQVQRMEYTRVIRR